MSGSSETDGRRVLVACRGAAAARILRWADQADVESVALVHEGDEESGWSERATYVGSAPALRAHGGFDPAGLIAATLDSGCDLLHGGWSPSARDAELAEGLSITGVTWTGPTIEQLGVGAARHRLREIAKELQIPVVPASGALTDQGQVEAWLAHVGTPAVARSLDPRLPRVALEEGEGIEAVVGLLRNAPVSLERLVVEAREVELPFLGNGVSVVVLESRDTSVRHGGGRVFVESPAPGLAPELRDRLRQSVAKLAAHLGWRGLGTARFLLTRDARPYLLQLKAGLLPCTP